MADQVILIHENKIQAVGKNFPIPADAKVIDLSQMTVLPGLIDCHTHLADGPTDDGDPLSQLKKTSAQVALESVPNARKMLESGFTTVRDVGVYRALNDIALRDAIAHGYIEGPRMFVAGAYITITGGAGAMTGLAPDIKLPWDLHYGEANCPWEVKYAIRAGVASIEHATLIDDEGIALAKEHGTYLDMDIYDEECIQEAGRKGNIPKDFLQHDAELGQIQRDNFRKAIKAGVKMAFGTDAGVCPYGTSGKQFAFMVKYGMSPMQAIQAATTSAADLLGHSKEFGSIKPGKYADVIAVSGDPLQDVSVLEHVEFVMKDGKVYKTR